MNLTVKGLVLAEVPWRESDKILTVLAEGMGKITLSARGAKRVQSPLMSISQPFAYASYNLFQKGERYLIDSGESLASFYELRFDLGKLALGNYITELARMVTEENSPDDPVLKLCLNSLYALCKTQKPVPLVKAVFELRLMALCGFLPEVEGCSACGKEAGSFCFDFEHCGILCEQCAAKVAGAWGRISLSEGTMEAIRYILSAPSAKMLAFDLSKRGLEEIAAVAERYLILQLGREPKSLGFYRGLGVV